MTSPQQRDSAARQIITASFKILFPGAAERIQGIADVVAAIEDLDAHSLEGRALPRRLEDAADRISDRLRRIESIEFAGLNAAERRLAVAGVERALSRLNPTRDKILQDAITTEQLRASLQPVAERRWEADQLGEAARSYGRLYLTEAAAYVSALVRGLPGFDSDVIWATYVATRKIDAMLERGIASVVLPKFREGLPEEVSRFEAGYRSDVTGTYKYIDLFGLNLPVELRRHPVDVAYIRLRTTTPLEPDLPSGAAPQEDPATDLGVDATIGRLAAGSRHRATGVRILLTGSAGSGKTTVSQWLAITAAQRRLPDSMKEWSDCVPFMTQLRYAFRDGREPDYDDLVRAASWRGSEIPGSWIRECLDRGEAIAIFDGLDELSDHDKNRAYTWIEKLLHEHPRAHFLITSRPDNLDRRWFKRRGFRDLRLLPMNAGEARECIDRWFEALLSGTARADERADYEERHAQLVFDFQNRPTVRDLSETPLLCAMLCAFYAHKLSDGAPESRADLYERVVSALIHFRDHGKTVRAGDVDLVYKQKLVLLEALARHMTITSTTTIQLRPYTELKRAGLIQRGDAVELDLHAKTATEIIENHLRGMVSVSIQPDAALAHLLDRSVVFNKVGHNEAQFAHRSIQEFLAGWAYADGPIEDLIPRVLMPDWRRVIVFAAGAPVQERAVSALVGGIMDVAESYPHDRRELLLLAAECLTAAGRVSGSVAARAKDLIREVLPPRSQAEARTLVGLGEELLSWLDGHFDEPAEVVSACISAAARVGGPAALKVIARYAGSPVAGDVTEALLDAWSRFPDADRYAREVLTALDLGDQLVVVQTSAQLGALRHVVSARSVRIATDAEVPDLAFLEPLSRLAELDCAGLKSLPSTGGTGGLPELRRLNLTGCRSLADLAGLTDLDHLVELHLADCDALPAEAIAGLSGVRSLEILDLDGCEQVRDFGWLAELTALRTLSLDGCHIEDLSFCSTLGRLRTLRAHTRQGVRDASGLAGATELRRLRISLAPDPRPPIPPLTRALREVEFSGAVTVADLRALADAAELRTLTTAGVEDLADLADIPPFARLTQLALPDCEWLARLSRGPGNFPNLEVLDLSGTGIRHLDFLKGFTRLRRLYLDRCQSLVDVSQIAAVPSLEHVSMLGGVVGVGQNAVDALREGSAGRLTIEHDPFPDPFDPFDLTDYIGA